MSQLALAPQNKFFLISPSMFRKRAEAGQATGSPDADLVAELDGEADSFDGQSPIGQYENCLSPGLDCAISDLVSLDSQAEVDQGIFPGKGLFEINMWLQLFSMCSSVLCQNPDPPLYLDSKVTSDEKGQSRPCPFFSNP